MKLVLALAAMSAASAVDPAPRHNPTKSPNDMICREQEVSGSRLDVRRVCMTRLQWGEQRRGARESLERAQTQQVNPKG